MKYKIKIRNIGIVKSIGEKIGKVCDANLRVYLCNTHLVSRQNTGFGSCTGLLPA